MASSSCPSPYDGTWSGTVNGSGQLIMKGSSIGAMRYKPYSVTYNLEITISCESVNTTEQGVKLWMHNITYAKASHPYFGCVDGCTPLPQSQSVDESRIALPEAGIKEGAMDLTFPNGAEIPTGAFLVSPDGKTITIDRSILNAATDANGVPEMPGTIGADMWRKENQSAIETYDCPDCDNWAGFTAARNLIKLTKTD